MRHLFAILLLLSVALFASAQTDSSGGSAAHGAEAEAHKVAHADEPPHGEQPGHHEKTYFGMPGWILKLINMVLFIGVLVYFIGGPVKKAFAARGEVIRKDAEEARARRTKADQLASDIQARLSQIEGEVRSIRERAEAEGEKQRRELIAAAEAEAAKILTAARNEVDNKLKHAREELTKFAGELATTRAEAILRERMTDGDRTKLFQESLKEIEGVRT